MTWSPDHTLRRRRPAASRRRDLPVGGRSQPPAAPPVPPPPTGISRRRFVVGGRHRRRGRRLRRASSQRPPGRGDAGSRAPAAAAPSTPPPTPRQRPSARRVRGSAGRRADRDAAPPATGTLRFANWIGYIDIDDDDGDAIPTLEKFTTETGIEVDYLEAIDDNEEFFTANLAGPLDAGLPTDWDLVVLTDWMIDRLVRLGWLETHRHGQHAELRRQPAADLRRAARSTPTRSSPRRGSPGMTGLGFDQKKTGPQNVAGRPLHATSSQGKMTYLSEMRDTVGLSRAPPGGRPGDHHPGAVRRRARRGRQQAVKAGIVRQVTGNSYVETWPPATSVLAMAWSGDVLTLLVPDQTADQDFQWVLADEGGMLWTDNMAIPKGRRTRRRPRSGSTSTTTRSNAATIEAYVNYVCPVKGAREVMLETRSRARRTTR